MIAHDSRFADSQLAARCSSLQSIKKQVFSYRYLKKMPYLQLFSSQRNKLSNKRIKTSSHFCMQMNSVNKRFGRRREISRNCLLSIFRDSTVINMRVTWVPRMKMSSYSPSTVLLTEIFILLQVT